MPKIVGNDTATRMFQYKILNILVLNKLPFKFKKFHQLTLCCFCELAEEII